MNLWKQNFPNFSLAFEKTTYTMRTVKNDVKLENTAKLNENWFDNFGPLLGIWHLKSQPTCCKT